MSFATPLFLWYFLPAVLLLLWLLPRTWRNALVSVASLVFYTQGGKSFVLVLLAVMLGNFTAGILLDQDHRSQGFRKAVVWTAVAGDLTVLAIWKYAGFASKQIDAISHHLGAGSTPIVSLTLPIGISFFTFHHISYVVDVYRHSRHALRNLLSFVTYIVMFPQLIAGPIVRFHEIADQLGHPQENRIDDFTDGFPRFALGLSKKVIVADTISPVANAVFALPADRLTTPAAWLGVLAYTLQIYFDFSGYSDMAIGLGRMLGFRLPENFNRPYSAVSMTDFWRRWHMSLSRWFRDYLYIPLGGNRGGTFATYRNLFIVFVATGFWHGAAWTFLIWGLYHGMLLIIERATGTGAFTAEGVGLVARRALTFLLVMIGWVLFRASSLTEAGHVLKAMVSMRFASLPEEVSTALTHQRALTLALGALVVLVPGSFVMGKLVEDGRTRAAGLARLGYTVAAGPYAAMVVAAGTFSPFLYFQF